MKNKEKYGFLVGKFAPFHIGHQFFITESLKRCDSLFILLSHDERFLQSIPSEIRSFFNPKRRFDDLQFFVQNHILFDEQFEHKCVYMNVIDESNIPEYPNGWQEFIKLCLDTMIQTDAFKPNIVFSSEPDYDENYRKYLPDCQHILIESDRKTHPISGTEIRQKMVEMQKEINNIMKSLNLNTRQRFRDFLEEKIFLIFQQYI